MYFCFQVDHIYFKYVKEVFTIRVLDILKKIGLISEDKEKKESKSIAKERLQFILVQDRVKLSPAEMESLKDELIEVITKYVEVNNEEIEMEIDREDEMMAFRANFPLK
ncbi:MAG: cell division topological specificity factor MinE [Bacillota bacterium]